MRVKKQRRISAQPERTIPARPEQTEEYEEDICDICQVHRAHRDCAICGRDVCKKCRQYDPTDNSDYPNSWCPHCLRLWHDKYETIDLEAETVYDDACEARRETWKAESLAIKAAEAAGGK